MAEANPLFYLRMTLGNGMRAASPKARAAKGLILSFMMKVMAVVMIQMLLLLDLLLQDSLYTGVASAE